MTERIERARQDLSRFIEDSQKSQKQVSKEIGVSSAVISQFLSGTYSGDNENAAIAIEQYLNVARERLESVDTDVFYNDLSNTKEVMLACRYAHKRNEIALVRGDAGAGKTTALEHYAKDNTGVIFVTADACTTSPTAVLNLILEETGQKPLNARAKIMRALISGLGGTSRLIIIDEADHLSLCALQAIRNLNDKAKVGIVLAGNNRLYTQMIMGPRGGDYDQIRSRIIKRTKVTNDYTPEEISAIFPNLDTDSRDYLLKLARKESLRAAKKIYSLAVDYSTATKQRLHAKVLQHTLKNQLGEAI